MRMGAAGESVSAPFTQRDSDANAIPNASTPTSRLQVKLDLNEFQLAILKQDLERFTIQYERMRTNLVQMQNQLMRFQTTQPPPDTMPPRDETAWHTSLDFTSMDTRGKFQFLALVERLMWPRNNMIRNMFERNIGILRFTDMMPNVHFWRLWFQKRQVHEYANRLRNHFRASNYIPRPASILDDELLLHRMQQVEPDFNHLQMVPSEDALFRDITYAHHIERFRDWQLFRSMYAFHEQDFPTGFNHNLYDIRDAVSFDGDTIQWQDPFFSYVYKQNNARFWNREKQSIDFATNNNDQLWRHVYDSFLQLCQFLQSAEVENQSESGKDSESKTGATSPSSHFATRDALFHKYTHSLCRVSNNAEHSMWVMSQLLRYEVPKGVDDALYMSTVARTSVPHKFDNMPAANRPKKNTTPNQIDSTRTPLATHLSSVIVQKTIDTVWKMIHTFKHDPLEFMKRVQKARDHVSTSQNTQVTSQSVHLQTGFPLYDKLMLFTDKLCARFQHDSQQLMYNVQLLELLLNYRLLQEENDFWQAISKESTHNSTPFSMRTSHLSEPHTVYENDHFNFSPLHFSKRKRITYKEKVKMMFCELLSIVSPVHCDDDPLHSPGLLDPLKNRLKQHSKQHAKEYRIVSYDFVPTVSRLITEESASELRARIRSYFVRTRGQLEKHIERKHVQEFANAEIHFLFKDKYPNLLDYRPDSHSLMVDYRHSKPLFALSALAQVQREREKRLEEYSRLDINDLDGKLDNVMQGQLQDLQLREQQIRGMFFGRSQVFTDRDNLFQTKIVESKRW